MLSWLKAVILWCHELPNQRESVHPDYLIQNCLSVSGFFCCNNAIKILFLDFFLWVQPWCISQEQLADGFSGILQKRESFSLKKEKAGILQEIHQVIWASASTVHLKRACVRIQQTGHGRACLIFHSHSPVSLHWVGMCEWTHWRCCRPWKYSTCSISGTSPTINLLRTVCPPSASELWSFKINTEMQEHQVKERKKGNGWV